MQKFQETAKHVTVAQLNSACSDAMIARRYTIQKKLGSGSFGSVYLVSDRKAKQGEELKVLKEISVGDLKPNETVEANLEAQLLSKLDHPAIVKFYASFVERDSFCIITEYCEGGDLDFKIQEYKESGKIFTQRQIIDWFIQLLLGVNYMHERRILHRDLKAKNIFLKNNLLKIGDFGVSCLLMGSCDLATTFTGTPYYMSPEALKHQGYNTKSDIWFTEISCNWLFKTGLNIHSTVAGARSIVLYNPRSLGCILYEMCCMNHAFTGHNFLSVVLKIVEGDTPSLPDSYPSKLNAVLCSMLNKNPSLRPAAAEILKIPYIDEQLKNIQYNFTNMTVKDKALNWQKEGAPIFDAVQRKVHLRTLQELSEVQKMTPRERMRLRKLNAADEKAKKLKQLAEEKYQENIKRMQEFRSRNFQQLNVNVLRESDEQTPKPLIHSQPVCDYVSIGHDEPSGNETSQLCMSELTDHEIPEDPEIAEEYYNDEFESCSEGSEEEEDVEASQTASKTNHQDSDIEAMVKYLESVLNSSSLGSGTVTRMSPRAPQGFRALNSTMAETKLKHMREINLNYLNFMVIAFRAEHLHVQLFDFPRDLRQKKDQGPILKRSEITTVSSHAHNQEAAVYCAALWTHLSITNALVNKANDTGLADLHALPILTEKIQVYRSHLLAEAILLRSAIGKLGVEVFEAVYSYLKQARQQNTSEEEIRRRLEKLVSRASDCFEVDQLLYFEEQLQASESCLQL